MQAETNGLLWAMDRQTFRRILLKSAFKKRKMYEELLNSVPMLKALQVRQKERERETEIDIYYIYICALQNYERMNLADALVSKTYENGERIIKQGKLPV